MAGAGQPVESAFNQGMGDRIDRCGQLQGLFLGHHLHQRRNRGAENILGQPESNQQMAGSDRAYPGFQRETNPRVLLFI